MQTIVKKYKVYSFDELSQQAQEKAAQEYLDSNFMHDWWDFIYSDAKEVGIKIESFDIDRASYCNLDFNWSHEETAEKIIMNHGEACGTYKIAEDFLLSRAKLVKKYSDGINTSLVIEDNYDKYDEEIEDLETEFKQQLEEEYLRMLRNEYEWLYSFDYAKEYLTDMDYKFLEDGTSFND